MTVNRGENSLKCAIYEVTRLRKRARLALLYHRAAGNPKPLLLFPGFSFLGQKTNAAGGLGYQAEAGELCQRRLDQRRHLGGPSCLIMRTFKVHHLIASRDPGGADGERGLAPYCFRALSHRQQGCNFSTFVLGAVAFISMLANYLFSPCKLEDSYSLPGPVPIEQISK